MLTKRVGWTLFASSCLIYIFSNTLNNTIERRKTELEIAADTYNFELSAAKISLAKYSAELIGDKAFDASIRKGLINSFSSRISELLEIGSLSHVGIYDKNCGQIFQNSKKYESINLCRPTRLNSLYWLKRQTYSVLTITDKMPSGNLISLAIAIDKNWLKGALGDLNRRSLAISVAPFTSDSASLLNVPLTNEPYVYDTNMITKHFGSAVSAQGSSQAIPEIPIILFMVLSTMYLAGAYIKDKSDLENKLENIRDIASHQEAKLGLSKEENNIADLFSEWDKRVSDISTKLLNKTHEITDLKSEIDLLQNSLTDQTRNEAITIQIIRTISSVIDNFKSQADSIDTIQDLLEVSSIPNLTSLLQKITDWKFNIDMKGPRKFLRSSFETKSANNPEVSIFEEDISQVIAQSTNIESVAIALLKEVKSVDEQNKSIKKMLLYWNGLLNEHGKELKQLKLTDSINQAISQTKMTTKAPLSVEMPSWKEPLVSSKVPAPVMTCLIFECLNGLISTEDENKIVIHFKTGSITDQLVVTKLNGKLGLSKEEAAAIQAGVSNANSFAHAYDIDAKLLAGTGNHISLALSWRTTELTKINSDIRQPVSDIRP